jgi:hypothetical protein
MEQKGWDCAECVELNVWTGVLRAREGMFTGDELGSLGTSFGGLLSSIANIRHTAVHRGRVTAKLLERFLLDAEILVKLLKGDDQALSTISRLRRKAQFSIGEIERNKDLLAIRLDATKKEFAFRREALDRAEKAQIAEMLLEDFDYQRSIGERLEMEISRTSLDLSQQSEGDDGTDADTHSGNSGLEDELGETVLNDDAGDDEHSVGVD